MMQLGKRPSLHPKLPSYRTGNSRANSHFSESQKAVWLEYVISTWWMLKNSIQLLFRKKKSKKKNKKGRDGRKKEERKKEGRERGREEGKRRMRQSSLFFPLN